MLGRCSGTASELLEPLYNLLCKYVLMPGKIYTENVPDPLQETGSGKTRAALL